jgi:hypothetical protein
VLALLAPQEPFLVWLFSSCTYPLDLPVVYGQEGVQGQRGAGWTVRLIWLIGCHRLVSKMSLGSPGYGEIKNALFEHKGDYVWL